MKKVISTFILAILFGGLFLVGTNKASAEDSAVFRLYPLTASHFINESEVRYGYSFREKVSGKIHKGVDIMAPADTPVYKYEDSDAEVIRNNTNQNTGKKHTDYWNALLIVYYPSLDRYVYYGHIVSDLPRGKIDNQISKLGTIRAAYDEDQNLAPDEDHLHLGVASKLPPGKWGYSESDDDKEYILTIGWLDPVEFMRGHGETLQKYLNDQTNNTSTESTATTTEEISNPDFSQRIGDFFKSLLNGISSIFSKAKSAFGAEKENQTSLTNSSDAPNGYDTDSGTFMFALCALSDSDLYRSPLDTGQAVPTADGYILKCDLMEYVNITFDEYQILLEEVCLEKMVHGSLWDISINHIYEYPSTDPEGCFDIVLDVSIDGGYTDTYRLNRIPTQTQPAYLMYMGDAIYEFTETKQFFISGDTEVIYEDLSEGLYGESSSETFKEYLEKGGFRFGFSGKYAIRYFADVSNGRITYLWPEYGY